MDIDSILKEAQILHENNQEFFDNIVPLMDDLTTLLGEDVEANVLEYIHSNRCIAKAAYEQGTNDALVDLVKLSSFVQSSRSPQSR